MQFKENEVKAVVVSDFYGIGFGKRGVLKMCRVLVWKLKLRLRVWRKKRP